MLKPLTVCPDLISHRLYGIRNNECLIAIESLILTKLFLCNYLDSGLFANRTFALVRIDERVNNYAKMLKSSGQIMSRNACTIDQNAGTFLNLLCEHLHVAVQISVL